MGEELDFDPSCVRGHLLGHCHGPSVRCPWFTEDSLGHLHFRLPTPQGQSLPLLRS